MLENFQIKMGIPSMIHRVQFSSKFLSLFHNFRPQALIDEQEP